MEILDVFVAMLATALPVVEAEPGGDAPPVAGDGALTPTEAKLFATTFALEFPFFDAAGDSCP